MGTIWYNSNTIVFFDQQLHATKTNAAWYSHVQIANHLTINNDTGTICLYWNHCWWTCKLKNNIATLNLSLQIPELSAPEMMGTPTQVATFQTCHTLKCLRKKINCRQGVGGIWNWFAAFNTTTVFPTNQYRTKMTKMTLQQEWFLT